VRSADTNTKRAWNLQEQAKLHLQAAAPGAFTRFWQDSTLLVNKSYSIKQLRSVIQYQQARTFINHMHTYGVFGKHYVSNHYVTHICRGSKALQRCRSMIASRIMLHKRAGTAHDIPMDAETVVTEMSPCLNR
jgi:hypothetical protein